MGLVEDGTEQASKVIDTLRGVPMLLSLIILNLATLGMVTYLLVTSWESRAKERSELVAALRTCVEQYVRSTGQEPILRPKTP